MLKLKKSYLWKNHFVFIYFVYFAKSLLPFTLKKVPIHESNVQERIILLHCLNAATGYANRSIFNRMSNTGFCPFFYIFHILIW